MTLSRKMLAAGAAIALQAQAPYSPYPPPGAPQAGPPVAFFHVPQAGRAVVECGGRPISLDGSHSTTQLTGYCPLVQITGEHNDITVPVPPAGTIVITAPHNDVTWRQTQPGPPPRLISLTPSNSFHPR